MNLRKLFLLAGIAGIALQSHAQTDLTVVKFDGSSRTFTIFEERKIYFDETNLLVEEDNDATVILVAIPRNEIRKLVFGNYTDIETALTEEKVAIYPNPASDFIRIVRGDETGKTQVTLLSMEGKTLLQKQLNANESIDLSGFPSGFYLIKADNRILKLIKR